MVYCIFMKSGNPIDTTHLWVLKERKGNFTNDITSANTPLNNGGGGDTFNSLLYFSEMWDGKP